MDKHLFHQIHQLSRKLTKRLNEALLPYGIYGAQWSVLFVLKEKGTLTQKELCDYLSVEAPPMTRTIKRLTDQGYVAYENRTDRRKKYITLTPKALESFPLWEKAVTKMDDTLIQSLPESARQELSALIAKWLREL
ncbi:winged helix DNA-binding protein [Bacillus sp. DNRA2]|uniref:MarR family winged helix-turn-helix transcriptional regulator n=1 Tax=Bacillus sp. DNRA2 TaxID=2723053 RepID=UPI00145FB3CF|nr:MarR family transcriptional regulator [Bacillus sp. DNRA2]NMD69950.1 winged helix DNA-binding protein [Bacillus sp. DNRA2]